jgi:hypothetical protein
VVVGRNSKQNDYVTFSLAKPHEVRGDRILRHHHHHTHHIHHNRIIIVVVVFVIIVIIHTSLIILLFLAQVWFHARGVAGAHCLLRVEQVRGRIMMMMVVVMMLMRRGGEGREGTG